MGIWVAVVLLMCAGGSPAASYTFTGSSDNLWTNKLSWTPNSAYPGQGANNTNDDVVFDDSSPDNVLTNGGVVFPGAGLSAPVRNLTFSRTSNFTIPRSPTWTLYVYGSVVANGGMVYSNNTTADNLGSMTGVGLRLMNDQTWDIDTGTVLSILNMSPKYQTPVRLTKTGAGDLFLNGIGSPGFLYLDIQNGKVVLSVGNFSGRFRGLSGSGVFEDRQSAGDAYGGCGVAPLSNQVFSGSVVISSPSGNCRWIIEAGTNKWSLSGNGNISKSTAGTTYLFVLNGTMEFDYSQPGSFAVDRISTTVGVAFASGTLRVTGSADGNVDEVAGPFLPYGFNQNAVSTYGGIGNVVVTHGNGRTSTLSFTNTAAFPIDNYNASYGEQHIRFAGSNLVTGANDLGTSSRVMLGSAAVTNGRNGILSGYAYVGSEFATHDWGNGSGQGVIALSAAGRPSDLNTANGNVLTTGAVPAPTAAKTNNSLKFGGAHALDLNGQTLTLISGGIIQSGADNPGGISNGMLRSASGNTTGTLYIAADRNLTIHSNVTIAANQISKVGEGKLTLYAAPVGTLYWNEGSLDYENNANVNIIGRNYYGPGVLTKGGTGTMTIAANASFTHTGGTAVNDGVLKPAATGDIGNGGPIAVNSPGTLWYTFAKTFTGITVGGSGTVMANGALDGSGTANMFTLAGCTVRPGGENAAGRLTVNGNLTFAKNGTNFCTLAIDVRGSGGVAGVDYDQLYVTAASLPTGAVWGVEAAVANRTVDLAVSVRPGMNVAGPLSIVVANTNFTGKAFNSVRWEPEGSSGTVNYLNGSITLTNVRSPSGSVFLVR